MKTIKNAKTIKINELTHKALVRIKSYFGYKTLDKTIDMCIGEFEHINLPENFLKDIYEKRKQ